MQSKNGGFLLLVEYTGMVILWLSRSKKTLQETRSAETLRLFLGSVIIGLMGVLVTTLTDVHVWIILLIVPSTIIIVFLLKVVHEKLG